MLSHLFITMLSRVLFPPFSSQCLENVFEWISRRCEEKYNGCDVCFFSLPCSLYFKSWQYFVALVRIHRNFSNSWRRSWWLCINRFSKQNNISLGWDCMCRFACPCVCNLMASAQLFVLLFQCGQAALRPPLPKQRLHNSARAKGTPTMIEHNDV